VYEQALTTSRPLTSCFNLLHASTYFMLTTGALVWRTIVISTVIGFSIAADDKS
jgi:hypothetical protein